MLKFVQMFKLLIYLFIVLTFFSNCNNGATDFEKQAELQYLDTLNSRLLFVESLLKKVDLSDIEDRKEIIENNLLFCETKLKEKDIEPEGEIERTLQEYKGLGKLYTYTISNYKPIVMQLEELFIQVKTLKESANAKDYNKDIFKQYFNREKADVLKLYDLAINTLNPCIETESVFTRRQQEVEELAENLKK